MSSEHIKILCVNIKSSDAPGKIKSKILKGLRKAEKKVPTPLCVSQPLQLWTKDLHSLTDIPASEVVNISSNSRFIAWLLKDGSVCRLRCTSSTVPPRRDRSVLDSIQRTTPSFQELSDAEYARQLQSEMNSGRGTGDTAHRVPHPVYPIEEDIDRVSDVIYIGTLYERNPSYYDNLPLSTAEIPPPYSSLNSSPLTARATTSRRSTGAGKSSSLREKVGWPDVGTLEWACQDSSMKFVAMAMLHSEILLVDSEGQLCSWRCDSVTGVTAHPLTASLGLTGERVRLMESGGVRASIVTETGRVATFYDSLLRDVPGKGCPPLITSLSHEAKAFPELKDDPVTSLSLSSFITIATTASDRVLWWGLCPKPLGRNSRPPGMSPRGAITDGSLVKLKDGPPCGPDTVVYSHSPTGTPLIGKTIVEQSGLQSRSSVFIKVYKDPPLEGQSSKSSGASAILKDIESLSNFESLDVWKLSDVVFLDDSPAVLGQVVTVDQHQAIVDVSGDATSSKTSLKVFKTSELELCLNPIPSSSMTHPLSDQNSSQHIAGVVQHTPLLMSSPVAPVEEASKSIIHGYRPLAVHTTNSGPSLLLENASNGNAFLVCSGQASHGPFGTSSYVALGLGSKPVRSTVSEESLSASEGGLTSRKGHTSSFVSCHNSQLLFLKDTNGQLLPLMDGLKLQPDHTPDHKTGLSAAYSCVHSRSYLLDRDQTAVLVMLVPRMKQLLSRVTSGDLPSVHSFLTSLEDQSKPKRKHSSEEKEVPVSKRPRLESAAGGVFLDTIEPTTSKSVEIPCDVEELFQCIEHNSNILHICCEISGPGEDDHVQSSTLPLSNGCGSGRRLAILETLLHCTHVRPHILKLLQSKNAFGHTPFYSAITKQNYCAALKILDFVTSLADGDLLQSSILPPSSNETTPLTQLFASLSLTFDITSGRLVVTNIPSSYRAQALLRLFQLRYPSVYKVVISREEEEEMTSDSSGDEESGDGGLSSIMRTRIRGRRHGPYGTLNYHIPSSTSLRGVVYFSDVSQLRSALVEMQGHRLSIGSSRNTGFGQSQQTNNLVVQLADVEEESVPPTVASALGYVDTKPKSRGGCSSGAELFNGVKHSHPSLAHTLLTKLLSLGDVVTTGGRETTLFSIVHNTKCLEALAEVKKGQNSSSSSEPTTSDPTPSETLPTSSNQDSSSSLARVLSSDPVERHVLERTRPLMPYTNISDYTSLSEYLTNLPEQMDLSQMVRNFSTPPELLATSGEGLLPSNNSTTEARTSVLGKPLKPKAYKMTNTECSCRNKEGMSASGVDLLQPLVSNWPCLVATILGFYPTTDASSESCVFGSVPSLDSFTSHLLLNCDAETVTVVVDTILGKMNNAMSVVGANDLSLLTNDTVWLKAQNLKLTEKNVALIVGRRFVESAVRVLAMNHSRADNTRATSQQPRPSDGGRSTDWTDANTSQQSSSRAGGGQSSQRGASSKEFSQTLWSVLSRFSWLSVASLVAAAEASIAPVRLGVAKPLGASSVASEYQQASSYGYTPSYSRRTSTPGSAPQSLSRLIHTRTALGRSSKSADTSADHPPSTGVVLTPMPCGGVGSEGGEGVESDVEMSDQDEPSRSSAPVERVDPHSFNIPTQSIPFPFLDLDTDQSDDEDFPPMPGAMYHFEAETVVQSEESDDERLEDIYPYAWALDGRRIGETSSRSNHQNVMANITLGSAEAMIPLASIPSIRFGSGFLARTFARLVKDLVDIAKHVCDNQSTETSLSLPLGTGKLLIQRGMDTLDKTWGWVVSVLDVAEGQLQRGEQFDTERHVMSLRTGGRPGGNARRSGRTSRSFVGSTPSEYIAYLIRSHTHDGHQSLPVLDLYGYEHVVYCLDGLLYLLAHLPMKPLSTLISSQPTLDQTQEEKETVTFFTRTESVSANSEEEVQRSNDQFFGEEKGVFNRPVETYPLAKQPHLLQPYAQKEQLFGSGGRDSVGADGMETGKKILPVSYSRNDSRYIVPSSISTSWTTEHVHQRWSAAISVFAHIFLAEGPGGERSNFLNSKAGFASRMARFRHQVAQLFNESQVSRDWSRTVSNTFSIRVRREHLLQDSLDMLLAMSRFHYSSIRVKFEGEDGSGPGVNRGFFASLANDLINSDFTKPPINKLGRLLHQPGKLPEQLGMYAPCPFLAPLSTPQTKIANLKAQRRSTFLSIGRFFGLCLWFKYNIPLTMCRHVAKFLLGKDVAWHDLAFYNADLYEGMRRMMVDMEVDKKDSEEFIATYGCYFEAPLSGQFSEPVLVDLIPGGSKIPVAPDRVHEYVRLYAMFTMVGCVKAELEAMKEGLNDVVPPELLSSLTAEDFQLLLSGGSMDISIARLKTVIRFNHTHGGSNQFKQNFERMFWRVVKHMNNTQRQQLLYFSTGSAALPATSDFTNADTPIAITIDVINSSDVDSLPVASTCSQRMSLPLYPSYTILKKKLLQAIQCQAYGLG